jgi:MEMO1 family protein
MAVRKRALPGGWYPDDPDRLRELVASWAGPPPSEAALAVVAPHAGWAFSGRIAARAVASLGAGDSATTVVVIGGHLPAGYPPLAAREAAYETPLGPLPADLELLAALEAACDPGTRPSPDEEPDNTVEVLLPIVAALLPKASVLWLRAPNDSSSLGLGEALARAASSLGRPVLCVGSTDLTHYGPNYGFSPKGRGGQAEEWVRSTNDKRFIDALLALDGAEAIRRGVAERSACSPGAAAAALAFALASGARRASLVEYATSLDVRRDDSFVGYAALGFFA